MVFKTTTTYAAARSSIIDWIKHINVGMAQKRVDLLDICAEKALRDAGIDSLCHMMIPLFAMTIGSSQSSELEIPYTTHETDHPRCFC